MKLFATLFGKKDSTDLSQAIKEGAFLVDVRTTTEFAQGTVKGAVNIPLNSIPGQLNRFKNKKSIIVFCLSGGRSSQAKTILEQNGINNVINGGAWQNVARVHATQH